MSAIGMPSYLCLSAAKRMQTQDSPPVSAERQRKARSQMGGLAPFSMPTSDCWISAWLRLGHGAASCEYDGELGDFNP